MGEAEVVYVGKSPDRKNVFSNVAARMRDSAPKKEGLPFMNDNPLKFEAARYSGEGGEPGDFDCRINRQRKKIVL
jgi:hypothetical protein